MRVKNIFSGRKSYSYKTIILNGAALSNVMSFYEYAYGMLHMPSAWTAASIGFQVASELDGPFLPLYDEAGALVEVTVAVDQAFSLPVEVLSARYVKIWSETAGSGVNQAADRNIIVDMKS